MGGEMGRDLERLGWKQRLPREAAGAPGRPAGQAAAVVLPAPRTHRLGLATPSVTFTGGTWPLCASVFSSLEQGHASPPGAWAGCA